MKKIAYALLVLTMAVFLMNPVCSEARGYHGGGYGGWWAPWAILGGAAVMAPYYYHHYAPYYPPYYYAPPPVVIRERPPEYIPPAPSLPAMHAERMFVYPRQGQSEEQQAKDRYECHDWAVHQTGYDPTKPTAGEMPADRRNQMHADYLRAQSACLDGRGYTMR